MKSRLLLLSFVLAILHCPQAWAADPLAASGSGEHWLSSMLLAAMGLFGISVFGSRFERVRGGALPARPARIGRFANRAILGSLLCLLPSSASSAPITTLVISEVMFNPSGPDDQREWVEIFNGTGSSIDLSSYSLGWGGGDYTAGSLQLAGSVASGQYMVIGGPLSDAGNGNPSYDMPVDFAPGLWNGGIAADGVALFDMPSVLVTPATVPRDAVIYGLFNFDGLMDETGSPGAVDYFGFGAAGSSIEVTETGWQLQGAPSPGSGPLVNPEPTTAVLLALGLACLAGQRRARAMKPIRV